MRILLICSVQTDPVLQDSTNFYVFFFPENLFSNFGFVVQIKTKAKSKQFNQTGHLVSILASWFQFGGLIDSSPCCQVLQNPPHVSFAALYSSFCRGSLLCACEGGLFDVISRNLKKARERKKRHFTPIFSSWGI